MNTPLLCFAAVAAALVLGAVSAGGNTFTVTNTNNNGPGSLAQAITDSNSLSGDDFIQFDLPGTGPQVIALTSPLPVITGNVTINGGSNPATDNPITVRRSPASGTPQFRVFTVSNGAAAGPVVTIAQLTISNGIAHATQPGNKGGAIYNDGELRLSSCTISNNEANDGGGVYNQSVSTATASVHLTNCTLSNNTATNYGGAAYNNAGF